LNASKLNTNNLNVSKLNASNLNASKLNASKLNTSHYNLGHGCPIEPMARISVRKFLGQENYKDVIFLSRARTPDRTNGKNFRQEILGTRKLQGRNFLVAGTDAR